jgi:hypothetical protein
MDRIIGVITGLATVCLAFSIFASHIQEWIASFLSKRSVDLEDSIRQMLADPDLTRAFFQHPLIVSLAKARPQNTKSGSANKVCLPTYIPADIFRKVLQSLLTGQFAPKATMFMDVLQQMPDTSLAHTLGAVTLGATDEKAIEASIESWYNASMDRLSGLYKRKTQLNLFLVGLVMAVILNANLIHVTTVLWNTPAARDEASVVALKYANDPACGKNATAPDRCGPTSWNDLQTQLSTMPVGWSQADAEAWQRLKLMHLQKHQILTMVIFLLGWLLTGFAVSLGSPFWFDLLNQFINLRMTGPKPVTGTAAAP